MREDSEQFDFSSSFWPNQLKNSFAQLYQEVFCTSTDLLYH